jgi:hypothetical protein
MKASGLALGALLLLGGQGGSPTDAGEPQKRVLVVEVYVRDAAAQARAVAQMARLGHDPLDRALWTESATRITRDLAAAERHLGYAGEGARASLGDSLRAAFRADLALSASLAREDHREVRQQAEAVLGQLLRAQEALAQLEHALGVTPLARVVVPAVERVRGSEERLPVEVDRPESPPRVAPPALPANPQPGDVAVPAPAPVRPH